MALESIIKNEMADPVMVDMPVMVEQKREQTEKSKKKIPWRWMAVGIGGGVALLVLIIMGITALGKASRSKPDLELTAPQGERPVPTGTAPTPEAVLVSGPYRNLIEGYEIVPPLGWVIDDSRKSNDAVIFLHPDPKIIDNLSFTTIVSVETSAAERVALSDQVSEIKRGLTSAFPDMKIEDDLQIYLQGRPYYLIGGTYYLGTVQMRRRSLITIYNDRGFAISASGPVLTWGDLETVITDTMYSFRIL